MAYPAVRIAACLAFAAAVFPASVFARPTGEPQGCGNCHYKAQGPVIDVNFSKATPNLGETVTMNIKLTAVNSEAKRTGVWVTGGDGKFALVDTVGTRLHETGVLHSEPKNLVDGKAEFSFKWTAPNDKGVSDFRVSSITGNTNGTSEDDHNSSISVSIAYGCNAKIYYPDTDGDGFGDKKNGKLSCDPIPDSIEKGEDCDDTKADINPDATEQCNAADDNCDGEADEGLEPGLYYKDDDGDGFAATSAKAEFTCKDNEGFVAVRKDCAPKDPDINPDAEEVKNGKDDNCDGEIDEGVDDDDDDEAKGGCAFTPGHRTNGLAVAFVLGLVLLGAKRRRR